MPWPVIPFSQSTDKLCWEACARMLWNWRHKSMNGYRAPKDLTGEWNHTRMDGFYRSLGLRSFHHPKGPNLRHALRWSPVIFTEVEKKAGHALVAMGLEKETYLTINPCGLEMIDYENEDTSGTAKCEAQEKRLLAKEVERKLGTYIWYW